MPAPLPASHVANALTLEADGEVWLYDLSPLAGGTIHFKSDDDFTWRGTLYEGIPCALSGEEFDTDKLPQPRLRIGQEDLDLLPFKGLISEGYLEGATLVRHKVLVQDLVNNLDVKQSTYFRVKRVESYSRSQISLTLASYSVAVKQTLPFRQYIPPDFPWVDL